MRVTHKHGWLLIFFYLIVFEVRSQKFVDPCFQSIDSLGFFYGSPYLINFAIEDSYIATDLMEWDGEHWKGSLDGANVDIVPPEGCSKRAIWMGDELWTSGGEAFGLRLEKPLKKGNSYSFVYTYASNGTHSNGHFSPYVYLAPGDGPDISSFFPVGRMPEVGREWTTDSITVAIDDRTNNYTWVILWARESSGIVLSKCEVRGDIEHEGIKCLGDSIKLQAPNGFEYEYQWSTGDTTNTIYVKRPDTYSVKIINHSCEKQDVVDIDFSDCEVRLEMPKVFTPNGDSLNATFKPISHNNIASGVIRIFNRWGESITTVDLFTGWNGNTNKHESSDGAYYYDLIFVDGYGFHHKKRGLVMLIR